MSDDNEPYFEDDVDIEPPQGKKSKERVPTIVWMALGAGGLVIIGAFFLAMERWDRRRAHATNEEFEAYESARQAKRKALMAMEVQLPRDELAQRLIDSRLESIRDDGVWSFTAEHFVLEAGEKPLPPELVEELLGRRRPASRIAGKWKLTEDRGLRLTDIRGDGNAGLEEVHLRIEAHLSMEVPGGIVKTTIGRHQYNLYHVQAEKK